MGSPPTSDYFLNTASKPVRLDFKSMEPEGYASHLVENDYLPNQNCLDNNTKQPNKNNIMCIDRSQISGSIVTR